MHSVANDLTTTGGMVTSDFVCANPACPAERWPVCSQTGVRDLWLVAEAEDARPWQIAASVPLCPLCGTDLTGVVAT